MLMSAPGKVLNKIMLERIKKKKTVEQKQENQAKFVKLDHVQS